MRVTRNCPACHGAFNSRYSHHFKFKINRFKKTRAPQHKDQNPLFLPFKEGTEKLKTNRILKSYQAICSHTLSYFSTMTGFESSTFQESTIFFTILLCFTRWATAILKIPVIVIFVEGWIQIKGHSPRSPTCPQTPSPRTPLSTDRGSADPRPPLHGPPIDLSQGKFNSLGTV